MILAAKRLTTAFAFIFLLLAVDAKALMVDSVIQDEDSGAARVSATPETVSFGVIEAGNVSRSVNIDLLNDDPGAALIGAIMTDDAAIGYPVAGPSFPVALGPGESLTITLVYTNDNKTSTQRGDITVLYTSTLGAEELAIPYAAYCVPEGGAPVKPDEGWYLGPCFIGTLNLR